MPTRALLLLVLMASGAQAAAFDDLKQELSECLRFERSGTEPLLHVPMEAKRGLAIRRCSTQIDALDRADGRRLRGDGGLSPSTRSVIDGVFGRRRLDAPSY